MPNYLSSLRSALPSAELSVVGDSYFTLYPLVAQTIQCRQKIIIHPGIAQVSMPALSQHVFDGCGSYKGKMFGCMHLGPHNVRVVHSTAWDGVPDGRLGAGMHGTLRRDEEWTMEMFEDYEALRGVSAEGRERRDDTPQCFPELSLLLMSRV